MSEAQTLANRRNAQKSTGPRNTASTRYNALKHGLVAEGITELDDAERYEQLCQRLEEECQPHGETELFLVRRLALYTIRLERAELLEAEFITASLNPPLRKNEKNEQLLEELAGPLLDSGLPARLSTGTLDSVLETYQRYETALENRYFRTLHELERLQGRRKGEHLYLPAIADVTIHSDSQCKNDS